MTTDSITILTASELVLLNAATLIPGGGLLDKHKAVGSEAEVSKKTLAQTALAASFIGLEQAGEVRLEIRVKKAIFGLRSVTALYVEPTGSSGPLPEASLEGQLLALARELSSKKGQNEVQSIVYHWLGSDSVDPFEQAIENAYLTMARRGVLEMVEEKKLKLFTARSYLVPEITAAAAQDGLESARSLLDGVRVSRPDLHKLLLAKVADGISNRREQTDIDTDSSG